MTTTPSDPNSTAIWLALAFVRLRARLREEASARDFGLSLSQISILQRLHSEGPATAAALSVAEHVSQQAIAQGLANLKAEGLIESQPDPNDGRKTLISLSGAGSELRRSVFASRGSWLARAIESSADAEELATLNAAVEIIERLAESDC
ncbi:MAG: MarR family transcriptional regulator [Coriobacteriia bacterium]|nr:MarR family transcriptional regulator [Coriobacteriia bacterium]